MEILEGVEAGSVVAFRVAMGVLVAFSAGRFLAKGWVESLYLAPAHHLTYPWFTWVRPLPAPLMYAAVAAMIPLGLAIAARVAHPRRGCATLVIASRTAS